MMKRLVITLLAALLATTVTSAQQDQWCGYILIEGIPLLRNQLSVLEALTPDRHERSQPDELFQVRYNLDHTAVILEGCWRVRPNRAVLLALLPQTVDDPRINSRLRLTVFADGADRRAGAQLVRDYLISNRAAWIVEDNLP